MTLALVILSLIVIVQTAGLITLAYLLVKRLCPPGPGAPEEDDADVTP